jgi:phage terminase Nu1 subunit (DNA packaging protein)
VKSSTPRSKFKVAKKKIVPAGTLKGWTAIGKFLGTSPASAQTWAKQGMPVKREGRFTIADPAEVQAWLGQQSHMPKPAHILTDDADIATALKESFAFVRKKVMCGRYRLTAKER